MQNNGTKETGWATGTKVFMVPIRFWENAEPETGHITEHDVCGVIKPDGSDPASAYIFHDGYGHNVYISRDIVFDTAEAVAVEVERRMAERKAEEDAFMDSFMEKTFGIIRKK